MRREEQAGACSKQILPKVNEQCMLFYSYTGSTLAEEVCSCLTLAALWF